MPFPAATTSDRRTQGRRPGNPLPNPLVDKRANPQLRKIERTPHIRPGDGACQGDTGLGPRESCPHPRSFRATPGGTATALLPPPRRAPRCWLFSDSVLDNGKGVQGHAPPLGRILLRLRRRLLGLRLDRMVASRRAVAPAGAGTAAFWGWRRGPGGAALELLTRRASLACCFWSNSRASSRSSRRSRSAASVPSSSEILLPPAGLAGGSRGAAAAQASLSSSSARIELPSSRLRVRSSSPRDRASSAHASATSPSSCDRRFRSVSSSTSFVFPPPASGG